MCCPKERARRGRAAAGARRNNQGDRQSVPAALPDHARHSDLGRGRRTRPLHVGLVRLLRTQGHAERRRRQAQRRHGAGSRRSGGRFADLGLDVASREQQTPEGLAAFHNAEIEKWWPIIKAANIKAE